MLVRTKVIAASHDSRTIRITWGDLYEPVEREVAIRGDASTQWPSAPDDDQDLGAVIKNVRARTPQPGDSERLGQALFDALLGAAVWCQILDEREPTDDIELRLQWAVDDAVMNNQHWELLHDGDGFISTGKPRVAIVREVEAPDRDGASIWETMQGRPPRVLFAIGSELHDTAVRPAAEFLALLRELGRAAGSVPRVRFLEAASVERLEVAIADFDPDVVHLAAHGRASRTDAIIELRADDDEGSTPVTASQLMPALRTGTSLPMVVLSACTTAQSAQQLVGAQQPVGLGVAIAPFAAQLVAAGVPAVVGMSGEVTDRTCRLFARRFGSSLANGAPLAHAASDARRAAFQNQEGSPPDTSVDWALPSLFVASDMPSSFVPVDATVGAKVRERIETGYRMSLRSPHHPVFAGRLRHIEAFTRVVGPGEPCSLLLHGPPGVGVNRLRDELAIFGVCEGALLVRMPLSGDSYPQNYASALLSILLQTSRTREAYGLRPESGDGRKEHLAASRLGRAIARGLDDEEAFAHAMADSFAFEDWVAEVMRAPPEQFTRYEQPLTEALLADLADTRNAIAAATDAPVGPVLLDLPELDKWGSATATVFERIVRDVLILPGVDGDARVRVLATYRELQTEADEPGRALREQAGPQVAVLAVDPFTPEEERIAIPWVLLHPWGPWNEVIVPQRTNDEDKWYQEYCETTRELKDLAKNLQGAVPSPSPVFFSHSAFETAVNLLRKHHHLISDEYSDAELLGGLGPAR